jgi:hypothetical protein
MPKETNVAKQLYAKGYRYVIKFPDNKPEPLYVKTIGQGMKLLREDYHKEDAKGCEVEMLSFTHVRDVYEKLVRAVGELMLVGIWYSDACEIVWIVLNVEHPPNDAWWEEFEVDTNVYTQTQMAEHGREIPSPNLKRPLF